MKFGRYTQPDTIIPSPTNPQSFNRYSYCDNNPINYTDPTGHKKFRDFMRKFGDYFSPFGRAVATGEWKHFGIVVATMAANMLLPGAGTLSSNFLLNVGLHAARGAAIGAVTGGISSEVMGGSFRDGARLGAISGVISGSIQGITSSEQFGNFMGGNGFRSNNDVRAQQVRIANMRASLGMSRETMMSAARSAQAAENGVAGSMARDLRSATTFGWSDVYGDISMRLNAQLNSTQPVFSPSGVNMLAGAESYVSFWREWGLPIGASGYTFAVTGNGPLSMNVYNAVNFLTSKEHPIPIPYTPFEIPLNPEEVY